MRDVASIRQEFRDLKAAGKVLRSVRGEQSDGDTLEILNAQFVADEPIIFGKENPDYVQRELDWYLSQSRNVWDIDEPVPAIWKKVSGENGEINSNYGWCVFSKENGSQFDHCRASLAADHNTRQATMIYQRPSMHVDSTRHGMHDFICTYGAQLSIRPEPMRDEDGKMLVRFPFDHDLGTWRPRLHYTVFMRSNDAVFGYKNDLAWHRYVRDLMVQTLVSTEPTLKHLDAAPIAWHSASLHVYRRHFDLVKW